LPPLRHGVCAPAGEVKETPTSQALSSLRSTFGGFRELAPNVYLNQSAYSPDVTTSVFSTYHATRQTVQEKDPKNVGTFNWLSMFILEIIERFIASVGYIKQLRQVTVDNPWVTLRGLRKPNENITQPGRLHKAHDNSRRRRNTQVRYGRERY
jgi:hypothetical protein